MPHGGIYSQSKPRQSVIDFSSNINPLGVSSVVKKAIRNFDSISTYPDPNSIRLRKRLQQYTKIPSEQIVVGNGATEIIYNFCHSFISNNASVLIPIPTFGEYESAAKLFSSKIKFFKTMNLNDSFKTFLTHIPKNGCIFLCNPNNPTGMLLSKKILLEIIKESKKKSTLVFLDECFIELTPDHNESLSAFVKKYDNLFILRSFTKSFGLAGLRIGYGFGSKQIISILNKIKIPWNVSGLAQKAAEMSLDDHNFLKKSQKLVKKESNYLQNSISKLDGFDCYPTHTNFILIKTKMNSKIIQNKLLAKNILIRDCSSFKGLDKNHIRIAVKTRKHNQILVKELSRLK